MYLSYDCCDQFLLQTFLELNVEWIPSKSRFFYTGGSSGITDPGFYINSEGALNRPSLSALKVVAKRRPKVMKERIAWEKVQPSELTGKDRNLAACQVKPKPFGKSGQT